MISAAKRKYVQGLIDQIAETKGGTMVTVLAWMEESRRCGVPFEDVVKEAKKQRDAAKRAKPKRRRGDC